MADVFDLQLASQKGISRETGNSELLRSKLRYGCQHFCREILHGFAFSTKKFTVMV